MAISTPSDMSELQAVAAAVAQSNLEHAFAVASEALRNGRRHPAFYNARALRFQNQGRLDEALSEYQRALAMTPHDANLLNALGMCYAQHGDLQNAVAAFDTALQIEPRSAASLFRKGWAHTLAGDDNAARNAFERTLEVEPEHGEALAGLAAIFARSGDTERARALAARCLERNPKQPTAAVAMAIAEMDAGRHGEAEALLRRALDDAEGRTRAVLLGQLGRALEGLGRVEDAFDAYRMRGDELRRLHARQIDAQAPASKVMASRSAYINSAPAEKWRTAPDVSPNQAGEKGHVFLLGFMNSGTAQIERELCAHADVALLSGRNTVDELAKLYMDVPFGLDRLGALDAAALHEAREGYWRRVRAFGVEPSDKVFIDSQPMNTINLPLIARLFPDAKVVMALRDPRDAALAAFTAPYEITPLTYELLDVASAARLYASVMNLAALCRAKLPLDVIDLRYEDLLADREGRLRALFDQLGLRYTPMGDAARAGNRQEPEDQPGRWRRYETHLAPAMPALAPWVRHFGYNVA